MLLISQTALELGFMYALVAMALFLSYRILDIADRVIVLSDGAVAAYGAREEILPELLGTPAGCRFTVKEGATV